MIHTTQIGHKWSNVRTIRETENLCPKGNPPAPSARRVPPCESTGRGHLLRMMIQVCGQKDLENAGLNIRTFLSTQCTNMQCESLRAERGRVGYNLPTHPIILQSSALQHKDE